MEPIPVPPRTATKKLCWPVVRAALLSLSRQQRQQPQPTELGWWVQRWKAAGRGGPRWVVWILLNRIIWGIFVGWKHLASSESRENLRGLWWILGLWLHKLIGLWLHDRSNVERLLLKIWDLKSYQINKIQLDGKELGPTWKINKFFRVVLSNIWITRSMDLKQLCSPLGWVSSWTELKKLPPVLWIRRKNDSEWSFSW